MSTITCNIPQERFIQQRYFITNNGNMLGYKSSARVQADHPLPK